MPDALAWFSIHLAVDEDVAPRVRAYDRLIKLVPDRSRVQDRSQCWTEIVIRAKQHESRSRSALRL
jgi:hypothetical protein